MQGFPRFVSMEVRRSEGADEVLVVTRWQSREAFEAWVGSEKFCTPTATVPHFTVTSVK